MKHQPLGISVVIASKVGAPFLDQCLRSLEQQAASQGAEVLVVAAGPKATFAHIERDFPWVRFIHETRVGQVPALRRRGVEEARGELIAIIEEHCSAAADWLQRIRDAHAGGDFAAVGGPIADADYDRLRDWVVYFCEYNGAMPPVEPGETQALNDANIAYRRYVLLRHPDLLERGYWSITLHPKLLESGERFLSVPEMVVHHRGPFNFGYYLEQRYWFSRAFAGARASDRSTLHRFAYLLGAPVIPFMLLGRIGLAVRRKGRRTREFVRALPLIMPALVVLVAGEWVGCLLGPGDALSRVE